MANSKDSELLEQLQTKNREELLTLLEQLIQQQPDIQPLLRVLLKLSATRNTPAEATPGAGRERTIDPANIRSQVAAAFSHAGNGWGAVTLAAMELDRLLEIGDRFTETGQWANAQVVYATIADQILPSYEELEDEDQLAGVLTNCIAGLLSCLEVQEDLSPEDQLEAEGRKALLTTLFALWKFSYNYGSEESDIPEVLANHITTNERTMIEQWVQKELKSGEDANSTWHKRHMTDFLEVLRSKS